MKVTIICCGNERKVLKIYKLLAEDAWRHYCQYQTLYISFCPKCKQDLLYWQARTDLITLEGHAHKLGAIVRIPQHDHARWMSRIETDEVKMEPDPLASEYSRRVKKPADLMLRC